MQKPPACSCVCPAVQLHGRPSSHTIMGDGPRGTPVGLHSLWGSQRDMRRSRQSRQPPSIHLSSMALSPSWSLSSSRRRPVVCGPRRSAAIGPCGLARGLSPLCRPALATARTVWQWHSGGERRGACNGGSLCGHIAHTHDRSLATAIIALHSPRAPTVLGSIAARHSGCDLRHRLLLCVTHRPCLHSIFQTTRARAPRPRPPCGGRAVRIERRDRTPR